jgi:hypothetical protein
VVLVAHGFPVNPITMAELHERVGRAGLLQGAHVGRLEIVDLDELEQVEALHEAGGASLATLLADKQTANLFRTALNQYLFFERRVPLTRPDRQGRLGQEVMERIAARYNLLSQNPRAPAFPRFVMIRPIQSARPRSGEHCFCASQGPPGRQHDPTSVA